MQSPCPIRWRPSDLDDTCKLQARQRFSPLARTMNAAPTETSPRPERRLVGLPAWPTIERGLKAPLRVPGPSISTNGTVTSRRSRSNCAITAGEMENADEPALVQETAVLSKLHTARNVVEIKEPKTSFEMKLRGCSSTAPEPTGPRPAMVKQAAPGKWLSGPSSSCGTPSAQVFRGVLLCREAEQRPGRRRAQRPMPDNRCPFAFVKFC